MTKQSMTLRQQQEAVRLIRNICCNHDNGNCLLLDERACPQTLSNAVCCQYFRRVLLKSGNGRSLAATIYRDDTTKQCVVCGQAFRSTSNNAKYCGECAKNAKRKQNAAGARKRRGQA